MTIDPIVIILVAWVAQSLCLVYWVTTVERRFDHIRRILRQHDEIHFPGDYIP